MSDDHRCAEIPHAEEHRCPECHALAFYPHDPNCSKRGTLVEEIKARDPAAFDVVSLIERDGPAASACGFPVVIGPTLAPGIMKVRGETEEVIVVNMATEEPKGINPKDLIGATKSPVSLIPPGVLAQVAPVFALGAKKYGAYNWRTAGQPVQHMTYCEAALRHIYAYIDGQTVDPESGVSHLAHAAAGLMILLDASVIGNSVDNRPTPGLAAEIMGVYGKTS